MSDNKRGGEKETISEGRLRTRLQWLNLLRLFVILLVLAAIAFQVHGGKRFFSRNPLEAYCTIVVAFVFAFVHAVRFGRVRNVRAHASFQVGVDVVLESVLVYFTGGVDSLFAYLFFASILAAALLASTRMAVFLASCATILLAGITLMYFFYGLWAHELPYFFSESNVPLEFAEHGTLNFLLPYLFFFGLSLHLVAFLSGRLATELGRTHIFNEEILENIAGGVIAVDKDGNVAFINSQAKRMLSLPATQRCIGKPVSLLMPAVTVQAVYSPLSKGVRGLFSPRRNGMNTPLSSLDRGEWRPPQLQSIWKPLSDALVNNVAANCTIEAPDSTGKVVPIEMMTTILRDGEGVPRGAIAFLNDVSLKRDMARARAHIESLRLVSKFSAGMAHEIRTPLGALRGCVQELAEAYSPDSPAGKRLLDIVLKESARLNRIVSDFLEFAKERPVEPARQNMRSLVEETVGLLGRTDIAQGVEFSVQVPADLTWTVDAEQMKQVLVNLVQNALESLARVKEIRESGSQEVRKSGGQEVGKSGNQANGSRQEESSDCEPLRAPMREPRGEEGKAAACGRVSLKGRQATSEDSRAWIFLEVADNGPGVAPADIERIFEPFFTSKPGGTGMGLAIAARICEAHGGGIAVRSPPNVETVFTVSVPG